MHRVLSGFPRGYLAFGLVQLAALIALSVFLNHGATGLALVAGYAGASLVSAGGRLRWLSYQPGALVVHRWLRSPVLFPIEKLDSLQVEKSRRGWRLKTLELLPTGSLRFVPATGGFGPALSLEELMGIPEVGKHFRSWFHSGKAFSTGIRTLRVEHGRLFVTDRELPKQLSFALSELKVETVENGERILSAGVWSMSLGSSDRQNVWQFLLAEGEPKPCAGD